MNTLPIARHTDVLIQDVGTEMLVYDLVTNKAYNLNETCSMVYAKCDGKTTFAELKRKHRLTDEIIYFALDELRREGLIENAEINYFPGMTRREVVRKVGLSSMVAIPAIVSLIAPRAANAASAGLANGDSCGSNSVCASNICVRGLCCSANNFQACVSGNDCCSGVACTGGFCCQDSGSTCDTRTADCCPGFGCVPANGISGNGSCQPTV